MRFSINGIDCLIENLCSCTLCSIATRAVTRLRKKYSLYVYKSIRSRSRSIIGKKRKKNAIDMYREAIQIDV